MIDCHYIVAIMCNSNENINISNITLNWTVCFIQILYTYIVIIVYTIYRWQYKSCDACSMIQYQWKCGIKYCDRLIVDTSKSNRQSQDIM